MVRPPARLSGRILQDLHESVPPRFLCLSNGDGRLRVAALDEGGSFRMAHLPPGRHVWRTTVEDPRMAGADELLLFEGVPGDLTWASLLLRPGREEHLEVNRAELPELRVSLLLDGAPPEGWQVRLVLPGPMAGVSSGGPLIVPLDRLGRASIRLDGVGVHGVTLSRTGLAVLGPECSWEFGIGDAGGEDGRADRELVLELTTCRVAGILTALPDRPLWLVTELPSGATWRAPLEVTPDGQFHAAQAMPGKARLVAGPVVSGWSEPEVDLASELTLATLVVPPEGIFDLTLSLDFETSR